MTEPYNPLLPTLLKRDSDKGDHCEFCKIFKYVFIYRTPLVAAFDNTMKQARQRSTQISVKHLRWSVWRNVVHYFCKILHLICLTWFWTRCVLKIKRTFFEKECLCIFKILALLTRSHRALLYPSKHFLFSKISSRRLQDVFSVTLVVFQDVLKTSSRRICDTSS